jgi:antibiotic biosynthesis monooxygenase (ABM) superfamily enzyme
MDHPNESATLLTSRLVRIGQEEAFAAWSDRYEAAARGADGYRGLVRLEQPDGLTHFVQRFADDDALQAWERSVVRRALSAEADAISASRDQRHAEGDAAIRLPSEQAAPKWKTFIATWAAVLPLLLVLNALVGLLPLPKLVRLPLSSVLLTASLTWFVLPFVRRRVRPWLLADDEGIRKEPD